jgi:hypothetical protein
VSVACLGGAKGTGGTGGAVSKGAGGTKGSGTPKGKGMGDLKGSGGSGESSAPPPAAEPAAGAPMADMPGMSEMFCRPSQVAFVFFYSTSINSLKPCSGCLLILLLYKYNMFRNLLFVNLISRPELRAL